MGDMNKNKEEVKWTDYLGLGFLCFGILALELVIKTVEDIVSIKNYIIHWALTCIVWGIFAFLLIRRSKNYLHFNIFEHRDKPALRYILISIAILLGVAVLKNVLLWKGFKPLIEFKNLGFIKFVFQYVYYLFEVILVTLMIAFGNKAGELLFKNLLLPWGGTFLGFTWGIAHIFTKDFLTGIVLFFLSILFGTLYILLNRNIYYTYLFVSLIFIL